MKSLKLIVTLVAILGLAAPVISSAQENEDAKFQAVCVKTWMEKVGNADKVAYKNFGEKYCACAVGKNLDTPESLRKASRLCISQIMLRDTMDTLEEDEGLNNLTQDQIQASCQAKWKMIYPDMGDDMTQRTTDYCQCASSKMMAVMKDKDNLTDADWYKRIDAIAAECADKVATD